MKEQGVDVNGNNERRKNGVDKWIRMLHYICVNEERLRGSNNVIMYEVVEGWHFVFFGLLP